MPRLHSIAILAACLAGSAPAAVIYVNATATGANDGTSWPNAFVDLQDALDHAGSNGFPCDIWIAGGAYKPDRGTGDRTMSFILEDGVSLYGGFAGWETRRDERDWETNQTVLEGDLSGNDEDWSYVNPSPCCRFQFGLGCDNAECYQRVTSNEPNCLHRWGTLCTGEAQFDCCDLCRPTRCDNTANIVRLLETGAATAVDGFTIQGAETNLAPGSLGGGIAAARFSGQATVRNCVFRHNAGNIGVAIYSGGLTACNCVFQDNLAYFSTPQLVSTTDYFFAAMVSVMPDDSHPCSIDHCAFLENKGIGIFSYGGLISISDSRFVGNEDGGAYLDGAAAISRCQFLYNRGTAVDNSGYFASLVLTDSMFVGNVNGGNNPAALEIEGSAFISNSLFAGNRSGGGPAETGETYAGLAGAIFSWGGVPQIANCTFVSNYAGNVGGIWSSSGVKIWNSILWNNRDEIHGTGIPATLGAEFEEDIAVSNAILEGWTGEYGGIGNSGGDPLFVDPLGLDGIAATGDEDYRLSPDSPAINAGVITQYTEANDLDGHPRVLCDAVDLGAYEFGIGDYDCDRQLTPADFTAWPYCLTGPSSARTPGCEALDFNADMRITLADFAAFQCAYAP